MQSSYSVIKSNETSRNSCRVINTSYSAKCDDISIESYNKDEVVKDYEVLGETIVKNARFKSEMILVEATKKAALMEKEGYQLGYSQGEKNGYEDGYSLGKEQALKELKSNIEEKMNEAFSILKKAEFDYKEYMALKSKNIEKCILEIAKVLAFKEIEKDEWILSLLEPLLEGYKGESNIIIKVNKVHLDTIESQLERWKLIYGLKGDVFVIEDMTINQGNVVIEKRTGRLEVGIDIASKEIENILSEEFEEKND